MLLSIIVAFFTGTWVPRYRVQYLLLLTKQRTDYANRGAFTSRRGPTYGISFDDVNEDTHTSYVSDMWYRYDRRWCQHVSNYELQRMLAPKWRSCCCESNIISHTFALSSSSPPDDRHGKSHSVERRLASVKGAVLFLLTAQQHRYVAVDCVHV
jgi:hypothetical protein